MKTQRNMLHEFLYNVEGGQVPYSIMQRVIVKEKKKTTSDLQFTIKAESVKPHRRIDQRFSLLPIFNVDPHYTGMAANVERNIEKGEFWEFGITIPISF